LTWRSDIVILVLQRFRKVEGKIKSPAADDEESTYGLLLASFLNVTPMTSMIDEADLRRFVSNGLVQHLIVLEAGNGWLVDVTIGNQIYRLYRQRGGERQWKDLGKLAKHLKIWGVERFEVRYQSQI
jgi:hypothetical protein